MYCLNRAQIIGNVTRDAEVRQLPSGVSVASFSVATNMVWTNPEGVRQEKAEFHDVVAWRKLAEIVGGMIKKGTRIFVEGRMQTREWSGDDGVKRRKMEIVADNIIILDRKNADAGSAMRDDREHGSVQAGASREDMGDQNAIEKGEGAPAVAGLGATSADAEVLIDDLPF